MTGILFFINSWLMSGKTMELTGTVVDFSEPQISSKYAINAYRPIVEYEYKGKVIRANYSQFLPPEKLKLKIGDTVKITVNPKLPKTFRFENDKIKVCPMKSCAAIAGIGLACLAVGLII